MANSVMAKTRLYRNDFQSCEPFFICLTTPYVEVKMRIQKMITEKRTREQAAIFVDVLR